MKVTGLKAAAVLLVALAQVSFARADTVVFDGFGAGAVDVFETPQTGREFYGRRNFPTFPVPADGLTFYFHRDTRTGVFSLGIIVDSRNDGTSGRLQGTISGLGAGASVAFSDDNGELRMSAPGVAVFNYRWISCCTDGGIITGLDPDNLALTISFTQSSGLNAVYLGGPGGLTQIAGAPTAGASFTVSAAPEPAAWALYIFGFAACATALKRRRRVLALQAAPAPA